MSKDKVKSKKKKNPKEVKRPANKKLRPKKHVEAKIPTQFSKQEERPIINTEDMIEVIIPKALNVVIKQEVPQIREKNISGLLTITKQSWLQRIAQWFKS